MTHSLFRHATGPFALDTMTFLTLSPSLLLSPKVTSRSIKIAPRGGSCRGGYRETRRNK